MAKDGYRDLFKGTAGYYARYRRGYPAPFFQHLTERFQLDGTGRLLDLGCGTGQLTLPLAAYFEQVVGMDPEPEMIVEAARQAEQRGVTNAVWIEGGSADLSAQFGPFRLVTMGSSFHWMDREATLDALYELIHPNGGIGIVDANPCDSPANAWQQVVQAVVRRWLGEVRRAGSSTYTHPRERHADIMSRTRFTRIEIYTLEYQQEWDIDAIVGFQYSTSYASPAVLGEQRLPFERDLRTTLRQLEPSGTFYEQVCLAAILAWKQ